MAEDKQSTTESSAAEVDETHQVQEDYQDDRGPLIDLPSRFDRYEPLAEIIAIILLAFATLATAWSGYQTARWGGVQAVKFSQAGTLRTESTRASTQAGQLFQIDVGLFTNWINAFASEDEQLAQFYEKRFRPEFFVAFEAWLATDPRNNPEAPSSPFSMPEYQLSQFKEADRLVADAEETFEEGNAANEIGDQYVLNTVVLASVLFLAGLASQVRSMPMRMLVILLALMILSFGLYNIITLPIE